MISTRIFNLDVLFKGFLFVVFVNIFLGHLSNSGDLLLWVGVRRRPSSVVRRASCVNIFFSRTTGPILTKYVVSVG